MIQRNLNPHEFKVDPKKYASRREEATDFMFKCLMIQANKNANEIACTDDNTPQRIRLVFEKGEPFEATVTNVEGNKWHTTEHTSGGTISFDWTMPHSIKYDIQVVFNEGDAGTESAE